MKNVCKNHSCVTCCYETEMLLTEEDVKRIVGMGFKENFFAAGSDGFKVLKNSKEGRCVFHDGTQCTIYENRPAGCRLYPIIFDEGLNVPVKDELCPYRDEFGLSSKAKRELSEVYTELISEQRARIQKAKN
ncbi:MAG: YkgJ family cysteine cluster protein [Nitrososphaerales archaeon]